MQYIPASQIINTYKISLIKKLLLPDELNREIIEYYGGELNVHGNVDNFWIQFGSETCNLCNWSNNCFYILVNYLGTIYPKTASLRDLFVRLKEILNRLLCWNYPINIYNIRSILGENVPISYVFYRSEHIKNYINRINIIHHTPKKISKSITTQDKKYIEIFITRMLSYFKYLENNLEKFPIDLNIHHVSNYEVKIKQKKLFVLSIK